MGKTRSKNVRTFIQLHKEKQHDLENDGIHLTFEMHNHVSQAHHPDHESASSLEQVDTNGEGLRIEESPLK